MASWAVENNEEGWGPSSSGAGPSFYNMPYAHFDKKDKCGKVADFTSSAAYQKQFARYRREGDGVATEFAYKHDTQEDQSFQLVDTAKSQQKNKFGVKKNWQQQGRGMGGRGGMRRDDRPGMGGQQSYQQTGPGGRFGGGGGRFGGRGGMGRGRGMGRFNRRDRKMDKLPTLSVEADWEVVQEFDLPELLKLQTNAPVIEDVLWAGHLDAYDETYDKTTSKSAKTLKTFDNKVFFDVTTQDDPVLEKLCAEGVGNVIVTDNILSTLMSAPRSVYTWDVVIQKIDGVVYMDKRDTDHMRHPTVSETAHEPPVFVEELEDYNQPDKLASEAYFVNKNFSQQVLREVPKDDPNAVSSLRKTFEPDPFFEDDGSSSEPASVAYRYRKFTMGDISIVARCHLHGWTSKRGEEQLHTSFALNEWDSRYSGGTEWRRKIDQQRGAVLATELKNNSCKLAKWTAESLLAGAHLMKLGYVSRKNPKEPAEHAVLATQFFKPKELAMQINMSTVNMWGIVKMLCDLVMAQEDGKFVLLKDPNKGMARLYRVPLETFEVDDDEEEEEEEDEEAAAS